MIKITLTSVELMMAAQAGFARRVSSIQDGLTNRKHSDKSDWSIDIDGASAEMAFAKHMGIYWGGNVKSFKSPDVGQWQVRSTNHATGRLIVRPNDRDPPETNYALVLTASPAFTLVGFLPLCRCVQRQYWEGDAWWVPQNALVPFTEHNKNELIKNIS